VFNTRRQDLEETYHVTFNKADEVITHTNIEGDKINFNENRSFPDEEFLVPRRNPSQCTGNNGYLHYVPAYDPLSTNNIIIPDTVTPTTQNINSTDESPKLSIADEHPVHNKSNDFESAKNLDNISEPHSINNDVDPISVVEPIITLISPLAEISHDTPAPQVQVIKGIGTEKMLKNKNIQYNPHYGRNYGVIDNGLRHN
nr:hypothetical protein [Tanacetum cinerariifolium]